MSSTTSDNNTEKAVKKIREHGFSDSLFLFNGYIGHGYYELYNVEKFRAKVVIFAINVGKKACNVRIRVLDGV